ncbi:hypothetical protein B0T16DRAFT_451518 [Cercophora newfieldiana]|uniref:WSC domain-containing protein n=1 Tax=Cercophora newfieldiana TaxID=92897 RepID=A0AA39YNM4_9PEZI|nr:hypothetical protein B0T16DRAFT_451518 [Cercophora newfieldiana]
MRLSLPATRALVAVAGLLGLADAQGTYEPVRYEPAQCGDESFVYQGCYTGTFGQLAPFFPFTPADVLPPAGGFPSTGFYTEGSYPGFTDDPDNIYDNSFTPLDCARVCRAYGFRVMALGLNQCSCGTLLPYELLGTESISGGACNNFCGGDSTQRCGGPPLTGAGITGADAVTVSYYYDPTFANYTLLPGGNAFDPGVINPLLADDYRHLGCYRLTAGLVTDSSAADPAFIPTDDRYITPATPITSAEGCFELCAGLGYPLVSVVRLDAPSWQCKCGTAFSNNDYRVRPELIPVASDCTYTCDTGSEDCDPENPATRCCAKPGSSFAPVYINPLLQGCYSPRIPGFKTDVNDRTYECYEPDLSLVGPPPAAVRLTPPAAATRLAVADEALDRPPVVNTTVGTLRSYYLYGCVDVDAGGLVPALLGALNSLVLGTGPITTLQDCANACGNRINISGLVTLFPLAYFGMTVNNQCVCGTGLLGGPPPADRMGSCNVACTGNSTQACGAPGFALVYRLGSVDTGAPADVPAYSAYSSTYLALPRPTPYACIPGFVTSVSTLTELTTVTATEVVTSPTTIVSGSVTVTQNATATVTTTFTTALAEYTRTLIDPAATLTRNITLIDPTSIRTLLDPAVTTTLLATVTRDGVTITKTVTGISQGTGPVQECYDAGCTLRLGYGALRLPFATPVPAQCRIETRSWRYGATTLLPRMPRMVEAAELEVTESPDMPNM